jgi:low temperature requirement protein LtrA
MTSQRAEDLVRTRDAPERASLLELIFDLAYVAAIAAISLRLSGNATPTGAARLLVLLMAIWWTWATTSVLADFFNPQRRPIQVVIIGAMFGTILLAATISFAFGSLGWAFAGAYVALHLGRGVVLLSVLRERQVRARVARFLFWFVVSGTFWMLGAFAAGWARFAWWLAAITIDYVAGGTRYPTPRLGRVPLRQYEQASAGHLGERYQQIIILALGDLLLVPTLRIGTTEFIPARFAAYLITFVTTLLLWQIYVFRSGAVLQVAINLKPARISRSAPYTHFLMVAGIVSIAAGFDLVISRPTGNTPVNWVALIVSGPILFLAGRSIFGYLVFHILAWSRLAWIAVLIAAAPAVALLPPVLAITITTAVLCGVVASDEIRARRDSRTLPEVISRAGK